MPAKLQRLQSVPARKLWHPLKYCRSGHSRCTCTQQKRAPQLLRVGQRVLACADAFPLKRLRDCKGLSAVCLESTPSVREQPPAQVGHHRDIAKSHYPLLRFPKACPYHLLTTERHMNREQDCYTSCLLRIELFTHTKAFYLFLAKRAFNPH